MPPHVPRRQYPESQPAGQREFPVSDGARWARWFWGLALGAAGGFLFARFGDRGLINVWSWWLVAASATVVGAFF